MRLNAHRVAGNLLMGAFPPSGPYVSEYADVLVLCARELQPHPAAYPKVRVIHAPLDDSGRPMTRAEKGIARRAAGTVRVLLDAGRVVLVTCAMGMNRSGLVCAMALMLPPGLAIRQWVSGAAPSCLTSSQAVYLVRQARGPMALSNPHFLQLVAQTDGACGYAPRALDPGFMI